MLTLLLAGQWPQFRGPNGNGIADGRLFTRTEATLYSFGKQ